LVPPWKAREGVKDLPPDVWEKMFEPREIRSEELKKLAEILAGEREKKKTGGKHEKSNGKFP
jgi:hypothetical protein